MGNVLTKLLERTKQIYDNKEYKDIKYFDLGKLIIWKEIENLIKSDDYEYYHYPNRFDGSRDKNGKWIVSEIMFSNEKINYEKEDELLFIVLYNSQIDKNIKNMSRSELLSENWNFTKFIKKGNANKFDKENI
jgi:hypothetical protein